jgi:amino acid adenylation domain-containing protein
MPDSENLRATEAMEESVSEPLFFPLSYSQERLWFLQQYDPGDSTYNHAFALQLTGDLRIDALRSALQEIMRRHEILRTIFHLQDVQPVQCVLADFDLHLKVEEVQADDVVTEVKRIGADEARTPFDLTRLPLLRTRVLRAGPQKHVIIFNFHHIIFDAWSGSVFWREMTLLYDAFLAGRPSPLPELPIQYGDYAIWQKDWLQGEALGEQLNYWKEQLAGVPEFLDFPTDRPRRADLSNRGAVEFRAFGPDLSQRLKAFCQREKVTMFVATLAAFEVLIMRYANQEDFAIGMPFANRNQEETASLIGFFVNTLVMRARLQGNPQFRELLARTRDLSMEAFAHQELPFEKLMESLNAEKNAFQPGMFQVGFTVLTLSTGGRSGEGGLSGFGGLTLESHKLDTGTTKCEIGVTLGDGSEGPVVELNYSTDLFDAATIRRLLGHYVHLLEEVIADGGRPIREIPLLSAQEEAQIREWSSHTAEFPSDATLGALFEQIVESHPEAVAIEDGDIRMNYRRLNASVNRVTRRLRKMGVGLESRVGICMERSAETIAGILGIIKAGGVYVPLDPGYPGDRLQFIAEDAAITALIVHTGTREKIPVKDLPVLCMDSDAAALEMEPGDNLGDCGISAASLAYLMYTSGTTGLPKGIGVTHRNVVALVRNVDYVHLTHEDRLTHVCSISFDAATFEIWSTLLNGACMVVVPRSVLLSVPQMVETLKAKQITTLGITTAMFNQMAHDAPADLGRVRNVLFGGETVDPNAIRRLLDSGKPENLVNCYGPTEGTTLASWYNIAALSEDATSVPIGRARVNTEAYVLDGELQMTPVGVLGELCIGGDGLARGYWQRADLTANAFVPNPFASRPGERLYRTGDRAYYRPDGNIMFAGRLDNQIKLRGFRIELEEVEGALRNLKGVKKCAVALRGADSSDRRLVAFLRWEEEFPFRPEDLKAEARRQLPEYMVPALFVEVSGLPLNANGKVDRNALPEVSFAQAESGVEYVGPRTGTEQLLAEIWREVLGVEKIGIHDNFFSLGGHSLLATRAIARINKAFQIELPLRPLFEGPTIEKLAAAVTDEIEASRGKARGPVLQRRERGPDSPLSYAQERLWFLDQFKPGNDYYNIAVSFAWNNIDVPLLEKSLEEMVRRHEILRTRFVLKDGTPVQRAEPSVRVALAVIDLREFDAKEQKRRCLHVLDEDAKLPFDLSTGPMMRVTFVRLDSQQNLFGLTMHHIVTDEWSLQVLRRELGVIYEAFSRGEQSPLPELPVQYADYARWQREWIQGEFLATQLDFWKQELAGMPLVLDLPIDKPRPAIQSFRGGYKTRVLRPSLFDNLKALAAREDATPFMALLAFYQAMLARYSGQPDFGVGVPIANRAQIETENVIGFFVNTLVMRAQLKGDPSFRELLQRTRRSALLAYANQDLPFERLVMDLQSDRDASRTPVFQVMFQTQDATATLQSDAVSDESPAKCDLGLIVGENGGQPAMVLSYVKDLFEPQTIQRMLEHLEVLMESAVAGSDIPLSKLSMLTAAEIAEMSEWNSTGLPVDAGRTIVEIVEESAALYAERPAISMGETVFTYRELNRQANQWAHYLRGLGVGPEVPVAIAAERAPETVVMMLGVMKAGSAFVPLDPGSPAERWRWMIESCGASLLLSRHDLVGLPATAVQSISIDRHWPLISQQPGSNPPSAAFPETLAYIIFTSGSSGEPKGVMVQHLSLLNLVRWHQSAFHVTSADKTSQTCAFSFDACLIELWPPLAGGASILMVDEETRSSPADLSKWIAEKEITFAVLITPVAEALMAAIRQSGLKTGVRTVITGGDRLTQHPPEGLGFDLFNLYGPTETTVVTTGSSTPVTPGAAGVPHIGRALGNCKAFLVDSALNRTAVGTPGELCIAGASVARGYHHQPALTAEKFVPNPFEGSPGSRMYRTGDLARWGHDGNLEFLGRIDQQVKIRGFRVEPAEIEELLEKHESIVQAVVTLHRDRMGNQRLVAYVVAKDAVVVNADSLRRYLADRLPAYMVPSAFMQLPELPLTENAKIDRRALPEPPMESAGDDNHVACRTEAELKIAAIWQELLGRKKIGIDSSFFELGGHSMLVIQMKNRLKEVMEIDVPAVDIFAYPTIRLLAEHIGRQDQGQELRASLERRASLQKQYISRRWRQTGKEAVQ